MTTTMGKSHHFVRTFMNSQNSRNSPQLFIEFGPTNVRTDAASHRVGLLLGTLRPRNCRLKAEPREGILEEPHEESDGKDNQEEDAAHDERRRYL